MAKIILSLSKTIEIDTESEKGKEFLKTLSDQMREDGDTGKFNADAVHDELRSWLEDGWSDVLEAYDEYVDSNDFDIEVPDDFVLEVSEEESED